MSPDSAGYSAALEQVCTETVGPEAAHVDQQGAFPERGLSALAAAGLMGAVSAPDVGGLGPRLPRRRRHRRTPRTGMRFDRDGDVHALLRHGRPRSVRAARRPRGRREAART